MSGEIIVVIITVFGGAIAAIALEIVKRLLGRAKDKTDDDVVIRNELRADVERAKANVDQIRTELSDAKKEIDDWRNDYWKLRRMYEQLSLVVDKYDASTMTIEELKAKIPTVFPDELDHP